MVTFLIGLLMEYLTLRPLLLPLKILLPPLLLLSLLPLLALTWILLTLFLDLLNLT